MILRAMAIAACGAVMAQAGWTQEAVTIGQGAILRGLDKVNGEVADLDMLSGQAAQLGNLVVELRECRYPEGNPAGDAYAFLVIGEPGEAEPVFSGWMVASSPALNGLDHSRYDVWVLRCKTS